MASTNTTVIMASGERNWIHHHWMVDYFCLIVGTIFALLLGYFVEELIRRIHARYKVVVLFLSLLCWQLAEIYETGGKAKDLRNIAYGVSVFAYGCLGRVVERYGRYENWSDRRKSSCGAFILFLLIMSFLFPPPLHVYISFSTCWWILIFTYAIAYVLSRESARNPPPSQSPIRRIVDGWNERHPSALNLDFLISGQHSDVKIISKDGQEINAHKLILRMRNEVFDAMISREEEENGNVREIKLDDVSGTLVRFLLYFIYSSQIPFPTFKKGDNGIVTLGDVLLLAEKFGLSELKNYFEENFGELCTKECAWDLFKLSRLHNLRKGRKMVFEFMQKNNSDFVEQVLMAHADCEK